MTLHDQVRARVMALEPLNIDGLRAAWRAEVGGDPPAIRSGDLLRRCLAEQIQLRAFGQDAELNRRLRALARSHNQGRRPQGARPTARAGSLLVKEHAGVTHHVEVREDGFVWQGKTWKSLSQIARQITGVRWNGPRFFGLRDDKGDVGR